MTSPNQHTEDMKMDKSLKEIIEIVRISRDVQETARAVEDKTRPIITIKDDSNSINVVSFVST